MSCLGNRQRQGGFALWRLCFTILLIISLLLTNGHCRSTAKSFGIDASHFSQQQQPSSSARRTLNQEIGSPSELAWQAWLLVGNRNNGHSAFDSSNILRRITPKSIFIAPELVSCPNGYSTNGKGVCKPDPIKIDEDAQRQFFLKRLNALYGKFGNNRKKPEAAAATGPLQINIPIQLPSRTSAPEPVQPLQPPTPQITHRVDQIERLTTTTTESPLPITTTDSHRRQDSVAVVVYKVANDTRKEHKGHQSTERNKTTFFLGDSSASAHKKDATQVGAQVVPVAEIVDDMNETYSGVFDYSEKRMPHHRPQQQSHNRAPFVEIGDRFAGSVGISQHPPTQADYNRSQDPVTVYKLADDATKRQKESTEEERTTFFLRNPYSSVPTTTDTLSGHATPAPEVVDEVNESFAGVADNKIPVHQKIVALTRDTQAIQSESTQQPSQEPEVHRVADQEVTAGDQLAVPLDVSQQPPDRVRNNWTQDTVAVVVYKVTNDSKKQEEESEENTRTTFFLGSSNAPAFRRETTQISQVVPLAGTSDEVKETSFPSTRTTTTMTNTKIPLNLRSIFNRSDIFEQTRTSDVRDESERTTDGPVSSEDLSPTVVLLLSPTKLPFVTSTRRQAEETSKTETSEQTTTMTITTDQETQYTESTTTMPTTLSLDNTYNRSTDSFDQTTMTDGRYPTEETDEPTDSSEDDLSSTMLWPSTQTESPFAQTTTTTATTNVERDDAESTEFDIFDVTE